jgi:hypothetical protein
MPITLQILRTNRINTALLLVWMFDETHRKHQHFIFESWLDGQLNTRLKYCGFHKNNNWARSTFMARLKIFTFIRGPDLKIMAFRHGKFRLSPRGIRDQCAQKPQKEPRSHGFSSSNSNSIPSNWRLYRETALILVQFYIWPRFSFKKQGQTS